MKRFRIDDFKDYSFLSGVKHSPDGRHGCFVKHEIDLEGNKYLSNLWVIDLRDGRCFQLTSFDSEKSFFWFDNENIVFPDIRDSKDREKKDEGEEFTQYYKISIKGGEALKAFRVPRNVNSIKMLNPDTYLFTSAFDINQADLASLSEEDKARELKLRKENKDYEVLQEIPFWSNGEGYTNRKRERLYIYHRNLNSVEAVTEEYTNVELFNLNDDNTKAVVVSCSFKDKMPLENELMIFDVAANKLEKVNGIENMYVYQAGFISEDTVIFTAADMKSYGLNENEKFYTCDINSGRIKCLMPDFDIALTNSVGSDCRYGGADYKQIYKGYMYFVTTEGDSSYINRINSAGKYEKLTNEKGSIDGISVSDEGLLFIGMRTGKLQELYKWSAFKEQKMTRFNDWVLNDRSISMPQSIRVETAPGVVIDGWVIKPANFDENKKYPAILDIHGGPKTVYGTVFFHEMQYWASEGYAVFFCNPRGSDGKGNKFADIRGKYGTIDYEDIMKFTDEVLKKCSFIDAGRLGVTGGSYGGFMTNWIIGHTDRFKAAASQRSISSWITEFCTTDIGYYFVEDQAGATPWSGMDKLWEESPLKYADKVTTPTLFLHSEEDYRCGLPEGIQMFTALKFHGVESRLCMFRGENHELSRSGKPKHRLRRLKEITDWFNLYLKK
jgi:dipeptidyl aminopeptidase/acylaminoacyl peptidase